MTDFDRIAAAALGAGLAERWLPGGKREGDEWTARNPTRTDQRLGSFKVNLTTGQWSDFATGDKGGDLIALRAYLDGTRNGEAAARVAKELGIEVAGRRRANGGADPASGRPEPNFRHRKLGRPTTTWCYRDAAGAPLFHVCRFDDPDGGKQVLPLTWSSYRDGEAPKWIWRGPKPSVQLYGLDRLAARPDAPVLVVEGEKTADVAALKVADHVVVTWQGGTGSVRKADWTVKS